MRRRRERDAIASDNRQVDPTPGELYYDPHGCDGDCSMCDPDFWDREAIRRRLAAEAPAFPMAERVLAQAGLVVRLVHHR